MNHNNDSNERNYIAFISYRHKPLDLAVAQKLHRTIERFVIPRDLRKDGNKKLGLVFRDQDELPISSNLTENIRIALDHSKFLIVVCSKDTPESLWVQREITYFLEHHDRDHLLAILISGDPNQSFPRQLTDVRDEEGNLIEEIEPLAANIVADTDSVRGHLYKTESLRILASLIGCPYDALYHREQRYRRRRLTAAACIVAAVAAGFIGMLLNRNAVIHEQLLASMINESKALASLSRTAFKEGDYRGALENALDALPGRNPERPYIAEAEKSLSDALPLYHGVHDMYYTQSFEQDTEIRQLAFSRDGSTLATGDNYGNIRVLDAGTGELLYALSSEEFSQHTDTLKLYLSEDLLLVEKSGQTTAYDNQGSPVWSLEDNYIASVCDDCGLCLSYSYELGAPCRVIDVKTGKIVRELGTFDSSYNYPLDGVVSPDGRYAAVLIKSRAGDSADLSVIDLTDGSRKVIEENLLYKDLQTGYSLDFDDNGNLALALSASSTTIQNEERYKGDYVKAYDRTGKCLYTTALDFGGAEDFNHGALTIYRQLDYIESTDGSTVMAAQRRLISVSSDDGKIEWIRDLPCRVRAARIYAGKKLMSLILADGQISFCNLESGVLTIDSGMASMDCEYEIYGGFISDVRGEENRKEIRFLVVPWKHQNIASLITYMAKSDDTDSRWADGAGNDTRIFIPSPSGTYVCAIFKDKETNYHLVLLDPSGEKSHADTVISHDYYGFLNTYEEIRLTDEGKLILPDRIIDLTNGEAGGLSRSGAIEDTNSSVNDPAASSINEKPSPVITASAVRNDDQTYDLLVWEDGRLRETSSRVPLDYSSFPRYISCECRAVSPGGYAILCAQPTYDDPPVYFFYDMGEDKWTQMPYLSEQATAGDDGTFDRSDLEQIFAPALSHPWSAYQDRDGSLCLMDMSAGQEILKMENTHPAGSIIKLIFAKNDEWLMAFSSDGAVAIYDTADGRQLSRSVFSDSNLRFDGSSRYEPHYLPESDRLLVIYDDMDYTVSVGIVFDTASAKTTGVFSGISGYLPLTDRVIVKKYAAEPLLKDFYTLEEMEGIAESILGSGSQDEP